ncbi:MAG: AsmA family protein, partial [Lysobacterales bacterium]
MTGPVPARRLALRWFAWPAAAPAVLAVLLVGIIATGWLSLDAQRLREPIAAALTRSLGREVTVAGPARLALSFRPTLVVRDVRIANPAGFSASEFATIAELQLATDLLPLLGSQLIVRELRGREITVRLARSAGGRGNWIFEPGAAADDESQPRFEVDWRRVVAEQA